MSRSPFSLILGCAIAAAPALGSASIIGYLGNFDVINDTGSTAHGFEIELEGLHSSDISDIFGGPGRGFPTGRGFDPLTAVQRYGAPTVSEYSTGVRITYMGIWDGANWDYGTPSGTIITPGDNCWTGGGVGYSASTPCDHFGVGTSANPTKTTYSWLLETMTPGVLSNGSVNLPAPLFDVVPPAIPGDPPEVGAAVAAEPPAPGDPELFGEAIWVKVFTTELEELVELEDLIGGSPEVGLAEIEIEWQLLYFDPQHPGAPPSVLEAGYGAPVGPDAASILRRYEFFAYAGEYDPEHNEPKPHFGDSHPNCGVDNPNCVFDPLYFDATLDSDLGHYLGAQNVAANLALAPLPPVPAPSPAALPLLLSGLLSMGAVARTRQRRTKA